VDDTQKHKPVLYLLCGLLCDKTVWQHQIIALAKLAEVRILDFAEDDRIEAMAARVLRQAPACFALAGHSMGARVALEVVRQAPERVERLALLDTGIHSLRPGEREKRQHLLELAKNQGMRALAAQWLPPMLHPMHQPLATEGPLLDMVERMSPACFVRQTQALLHRPDPEPILPGLCCPVLVGVGEMDQWSPPAQHEDIVRRIPGAWLEIFADAGHMAPFEAPDAVTAAMQHWLGKTSYAVACSR